MLIRSYLPILIATVLSVTAYCGSTNPIDSYLNNLVVITDSTSYDIVSSYNQDYQELLVQFNLEEDANVGLELYTRDGEMIKLWHTAMASKGIYRSQLSIADIPDGTYLLNIIINSGSYQQAVFKY